MAIDLKTSAQEYDQFREQVVRHFAAITAITATYTRWLEKADIEFFFNATLERAFVTRDKITKSQPSITKHWSNCCEATARSRKQWLLVFSTHSKYVPGKRLQRESVS